MLILRVHRRRFREYNAIRFRGAIIILFIQQCSFSTTILFIRLKSSYNLIHSLIGSYRCVLILALLLLLLFFLDRGVGDLDSAVVGRCQMGLDPSIQV